MQMIRQNLPLVAIIGRTNVGKSTLFNRLLGQNKALTLDQPGVTRDRIYGEVWNGEQGFALVDTGGLDLDAQGEIDAHIFAQAREAVEEAQLILLVVDGRVGVTPLDEQLADFVRKSNKIVHLVVNKVDGPELKDQFLADFHGLGFDLSAVSAAHGYGYRDLIEEILSLLPSSQPMLQDEDLQGLRLALLGRPNVGKSSMINAFLGEKRLIVSPVAGTTRDCVDVQVIKDDRSYVFLDTAGVRKKARIKDRLEQLSVLRSLRTSKRAQVSILVLDACQGLTVQDKKLLDFLANEKVPLIVTVNKIDLIPRRKRVALREYYSQELKFCAHVPVIFTSSVTMAGLGGLLPLAENLWTEVHKRITTGELNRVLKKVTHRHQPPLVRRKRVKFYYLTQTSVAPPTFVLFMNDQRLVKPSYAKYLEKQIRKHFGFKMSPIRLVFRTSQG